ncbi:MAG TPA: DUF4852 domain-containing protein [Gemmatimonadaceae bacterium]|jgi:hypothetical protein|nr:DUF4852 domain-containing protein [Gemmatimonadaceae bacterium]
MSARASIALLASLIAIDASTVQAQAGDLDDRLVALTYHKVTGKPLDLQAAAEQSDVVRRAANFDRPDATRAESERIGRELASADARHEFTVRVNDNISEYDHARGEFSVSLFKPGMYLQSDAFRQQYLIVFDNAESARAIAMPKEQARTFDARLNQSGRGVVDEIHFRVVGDGDPSGAVTGQNVVRATLVSVRVLDRAGAVLFTPNIGAAAVASKSADGAANTTAFDAAHADVAGLRVGVKARDFETTVGRLFGKVARVKRSDGWYPGYAAALEVNSMGCMSIPGRRHGGEPGNVCVTAYLDGDDVVRGVRVERMFSFIDAETFRSTLVRRYGPVTAAKEAGGYQLGWGPEIDPHLAYSSSGPHTALTATYAADEDMMSSSLNAAPRIRVTLQLVDAGWATSKK